MLKKFDRKGFTLAELIIVMVVIGILATFITLSYMGISKKADKEALRAGARSIVRAAQAFEYQHPGNHKFYFQDGEQSNDDGFKLSYGNKAPGDGTVVLNEKETVAVAFYKGVFCATKSADTDVITVSEIPQSDCTTYDVIQTCDSWATIATANDVLLADLLDLNGETDPDSSTCGRDIKIPVEIEFPTSASCFAFNSGTGTITDYYYTNPGCPSDVIIPNRIGGVTVVAIGNSAFESSNLTSVVIPNTVTTLADDAFRSNSLTTITVPSSIVSCGYFVFTGNNFSSVIWNSNTSTTGWSIYSPFDGSHITSVTFGSNVTQIPSNLFAHVIFGSTSFNIPDNITAIGAHAFRETNLTSVNLNDVTSVGANAFYDSALTSLSLAEGVTTLGDYAFYSNNFSTITIPSTLSSIGYRTFGTMSFSSVTWNSNLSSTGWSSFGPFDGSTINSVNLSGSMTRIPGNLFAGVTFGSTSFNIPNNITTINAGGFRDTNLTSVTLNNVTSMGTSAFRGAALTSINLPSNFTTLGESALRDNALTSITFPASLTSVGMYALMGNNMTSITMGGSGTTFANYLLTTSNNNFKTSYLAGGAGAYTGTQEGTWTKM